MLSDEQKRRRYDHGGFDGLNAQSGGGRSHNFQFDFGDPFELFHEHFKDSFGDMFRGRFKDFDAVFERMSGGRNMGGVFRNPPGARFGEGSGSCVSQSCNFGGGFGGGSFMSQSRSTTWVNGQKRETISMNKDGRQIDDVYENDQLIKRIVNGQQQSLDAIEDKEIAEDRYAIEGRRDNAEGTQGRRRKAIDGRRH